MKKNLLKSIFTVALLILVILPASSFAGKSILDAIIQKPVITKMGGIGVVNDPGLCGAVVKLVAPTAFDANGLPVPVTTNAPSFFPVGTTVIVWTATDALGNFDTIHQNITVIDNDLPNIQVSNMATVNKSGKCGATIKLGTPITSDNCAVVSVTNNATSFFPVGTTLVTWTVTDKAGYTNTAIQSVIVSDVQNPKIKAPADITVKVTNSLQSVSNLKIGLPVTRDNCGVKTLTNNAPFSFTMGKNVITWTVTDLYGNTSSDTQNILVKLSGKIKKTNETETNLAIGMKLVSEKEAIGNELCVMVSPNPSTTYFTLKISSKNTHPIMLRVTDALGRVVEAKSKIIPNTSLQIGHNYQSGSYFVEIVQGPQRKVMQLIKVR